MAWPSPSYSRWIGGPDRAIVEDGLSFTVHKMLKRIPRISGTSCTGSWRWTVDGETCATIGYRIEMHYEQAATLHLEFRANGEPVKQVIPVSAIACRFGGVRWMARCPHTRRRVAKLYLPAGGKYFLARQAYRMGYRSQCEGPAGRALRKRDKALAKLNADYPELIRRPRGMRKKTFDHLCRIVEHSELVFDYEMMRRFGMVF